MAWKLATRRATAVKQGSQARTVLTLGADAARRVARMTGYVAGILGPTLPDTAGRLAAGGVVVEITGRSLDRWAGDPARFDYEFATRMRATRFGDQLPGTEEPLGSEAVGLGAAADRADAALGASLRAFERSLGAREEKQAQLAEARRKEAQAFAAEGAESLDRITQALIRMETLVAEALEVRDEAAPLRRRIRAVSDAELASLFLSGVRLDDFRRYLNLAPLRWDSDRVADAVAALQAAAVLFRDWQELDGGSTGSAV